VLPFDDLSSSIGIRPVFLSGRGAASLVRRGVRRSRWQRELLEEAAYRAEGPAHAPGRAEDVEVGLLGLAGHWGSRRRFWLPAALIWLGSGALVVFDGFILMFHHPAHAVRRDRRRVGLERDRTVLVIKVLIGVLAVGVGAMVVTAAAGSTLTALAVHAWMTR
jgi:hypothetical protein